MHTHIQHTHPHTHTELLVCSVIWKHHSVTHAGTAVIGKNIVPISFQCICSIYIPVWSIKTRLVPHGCHCCITQISMERSVIISSSAGLLFWCLYAYLSSVSACTKLPLTSLSPLCTPPHITVSPLHKWMYRWSSGFCGLMSLSIIICSHL